MLESHDRGRRWRRGTSDWQVGAHHCADADAHQTTNLHLTQCAKMRGSGGGPSVELTELTPQHLGLEIGRVASRCASWGFERFANVTQDSLDVVSFDAAPRTPA